MIDYSRLDLVGAPLEHLETYVYYDGPKAFALRSITLPLYYFVNTIDEDEDTGTLVALVALASAERYRAIRSGLAPFRDAFASAGEHDLFRVTWTHRDEHPDEPDLDIESISPRALTPAELPREGARLRMRTDTAESFQPDELLRISNAEHRTVFALEMDAPRSNVTAFPARASGQVQIAAAGLIESLQREVDNALPRLRRGLSPLVYGLRAASFVVIFALDRSDSLLFEPTEITEPAFGELRDLVAAVGEDDPSRLIDMLAHHDAHTRNRLRDLLLPLSQVGSPLNVSIAPADATALMRASASQDAVGRAIEAMDSVPPEVDEVTIDRGILMGLVLRTRRFEIVDVVSGGTYKGYMTEEAAAEANNAQVGDASYVTAIILEEIPFASADDPGRVTHTLISIAARPEDDSVE